MQAMWSPTAARSLPKPFLAPALFASDPPTSTLSAAEEPSSFLDLPGATTTQSSPMAATRSTTLHTMMPALAASTLPAATMSSATKFPREPLLSSTLALTTQLVSILLQNSGRNSPQSAKRRNFLSSSIWPTRFFSAPNFFSTIFRGSPQAPSTKMPSPSVNSSRMVTTSSSRSPSPRTWVSTASEQVLLLSSAKILKKPPESSHKSRCLLFLFAKSFNLVDLDPTNVL